MPFSPALTLALSLSSVRVTFYPTTISRLGHTWLSCLTCKVSSSNKVLSL